MTEDMRIFDQEMKVLRERWMGKRIIKTVEPSVVMIVNGVHYSVGSKERWVLADRRVFHENDVTLAPELELGHFDGRL